jgi:phosphoserine phosphatase RsbU/P
MKVLIAEDNPTMHRLLAADVRQWGFDPVTVGDGLSAWNRLQAETGPVLCLIDWMMPGMDGINLIRMVRSRTNAPGAYLILLTSKTRKEDLVEGLNAGADDYVSKPFHADELWARIRVGIRSLELQQTLAATIDDLEKSAARVKTLHGLLPICAYCKKIRDDGNYWHRVELYFSEHADVQFTHGICPDCRRNLIAEACSHAGRRNESIHAAT